MTAMTIAYISEHNQLAKDTLGHHMPVGEGNGSDQTVDYTAGVTQSTAFGTDRHIIRLHTDAACHILFGANPTATTSNKKLAAGQTEFFHVTPGEKVSIISA